STGVSPVNASVANSRELEYVFSAAACLERPPARLPRESFLAEGHAHAAVRRHTGALGRSVLAQRRKRHAHSTHLQHRRTDRREHLERLPASNLRRKPDRELPACEHGEQL